MVANSANAGIISGLAKLGKAGKHADVDVNLPKLDFPDGIDSDSVVKIKPQSDGSWLVEQPDGSIKVLSVVEGAIVGADHLAVSPKALLIDAFDLPKDLSAFERLPKGTPILIRSKHNEVFELAPSSNSGAGWMVKQQWVQMAVTDASELKNALWHLERPLISSQPNVLQLAKSSDTPLAEKAYGKPSTRGVGLSQLVDALDEMKRETVVLSASLRDGVIVHKGESLPIYELLAKAEKNDINLVLLDSTEPTKSTKALMKRLNEREPNAGWTTAQFFNQFADTKGPAFDLSVHASGNSQSLVQWQPKPVKTEIPKSTEDSFAEDLTTHLISHAVVRSIQIHHPDEERTSELDARIIPWLPSWIQMYLLVSGFLGLLVLTTTWRTWQRLWTIRKPQKAVSWLLIIVTWPLHKLLFLLLFLPFAGFFCFWYVVLTVFWRVVDFLIVRPISWMLLKMRVKRVGKD